MRDLRPCNFFLRNLHRRKYSRKSFDKNAVSHPIYYRGFFPPNTEFEESL
jgi:hypothetical protein